MKTLQVLRKCDPAEWSGTEMALHRLFGSLRERDVASVVYCPRLERETMADPLLRDGFPMRRFRAFMPVLGMSPERKRQLVSVGGNLLSFDLASALREEPDASLIHSHTLGRLGGIALTVARERQLPFVVTIHGGVLDLPEKLKQEFNKAEVRGFDWGKLFGLLFRSHRLLRDADAIVTCNAREAALMRERDPSRRVMVQPHGVPVDVYQQDQRAAAKAAFPQIEGRQMLLSLGRIDPVKNQGWLLDQAPAIFHAHPRSLLVLAGPCTDEPYGKVINQKIRQLGLQDRVLLTGVLPPNDPRLIGLLQEASVLLLPSLSETFGLVVLEAWAAGTPVLSSRTSGASALIRHNENGWLFDLELPGTFHQALARCLAAPIAARQMASRGTIKVTEEYSLGALAERMKALYAELVEENECVT